MSRDLSRRSAFGAKADRDRQFEQALKHELRATPSPAAAPALRSVSEGGCIDAETLAAWADDGLDAAQMASVELHVSTCARCQAILGATARSGLVAPGAEAPGTFWLWRWWLAPLVAGAAAVTLWIVVPEQRQVAVAPARDPFGQAQSNDQVVAVEPSPAKPNAAPEELAARAQRRERQADFAGKADAKKEAGVTAKRADDAPKLLQDKNAVGAVAAAPAPRSPSASAGAELQENARLASAPIEIATPNPAIRWRVSAGMIERSENGGAVWTRVRSSAGEVIAGGTAPSASICWFFGANGVVLLTADGQAFARVPLPERVDITALTAADGRTATATTADGRRFTTTDSGRTWRQN